MKINWFASEKYFCTDESVKRQITDSISENSTDSDLGSTLRKNAIESKAFLSKSMYIMDSNQYAIELVTYLFIYLIYKTSSWEFWKHNKIQ